MFPFHLSSFLPVWSEATDRNERIHKSRGQPRLLYADDTCVNTNPRLRQEGQVLKNVHLGRSGALKSYLAISTNDSSGWDRCFLYNNTYSLLRMRTNRFPKSDNSVRLLTKESWFHYDRENCRRYDWMTQPVAFIFIFLLRQGAFVLWSFGFSFAVVRRC